ncbi:oleosin 5 [Citrus sinensis]|uniref:oleosin 18.2 kDa n=1 Tax=Citrus sinensis TaxID=2711 RepID=UPI000CB6D981|nr:oleosin 18.2 kDa [Citrus sinensis]KAH9742406.1 oleosin 5 [Citrus sinensis]GAY46823.1 hypothetical protein CUMW_099960 [Citrus unshiu]
MAERDRPQPHQLQVHPQQHSKSLIGQRGAAAGGPSASKVLAVLAMLPLGGTFLALAGVTLTGTIIGLCVTTPLFIIFSPVIVPAAIVLALAVTGFLTSGAFGLTALSSLSWVLSILRQKTGSVPEMADQAKKRVAGIADYVGQKTKEVGQDIQSKVHEAGGKTGRT